MPEVMAGQLADNDKIGLIKNKKRLFIILRYLRRLFFLFGRIMDKGDAIKRIVNAARFYKKNYIGKNILYVYGTPKKPELLEAIFYESQFLHLTGVNLKNHISATKFYTNCIDQTLTVNDFELRNNGTTGLKLEILPDFLGSNSMIKMAGIYNRSGFQLYTAKLLGGESAAMGFVKNYRGHSEYYVPNTLLKGDIRKMVDQTKRVLAIYEKSRYDIRYTTCVYVAKGIDVHDICFPEKFYYLALDCITVDFPEKSIIKVENQLLNNKQVNSIYLPSGLIIDEKDVGRSIVSPDFIQKKDGKLTGIFEYKPGQEHTVKLSLEGGSFQKVDINLFKKAIEEKGLSHNKSEANKEKQNTKERHKENEEEL